MDLETFKPKLSQEDIQGSWKEYKTGEAFTYTGDGKSAFTWVKRSNRVKVHEGNRADATVRLLIRCGGSPQKARLSTGPNGSKKRRRKSRGANKDGKLDGTVRITTTGNYRNNKLSYNINAYPDTTTDAYKQFQNKPKAFQKVITEINNVSVRKWSEIDNVNAKSWLSRSNDGFTASYFETRAYIMVQGTNKEMAKTIMQNFIKAIMQLYKITLKMNREEDEGTSTDTSTPTPTPLLLTQGQGGGKGPGSKEKLSGKHTETRKEVQALVDRSMTMKNANTRKKQIVTDKIMKAQQNTTDMTTREVNKLINDTRLEQKEQVWLKKTLKKNEAKRRKQNTITTTPRENIIISPPQKINTTPQPQTGTNHERPDTSDNRKPKRTKGGDFDEKETLERLEKLEEQIQGCLTKDATADMIEDSCNELASETTKEIEGAIAPISEAQKKIREKNSNKLKTMSNRIQKVEEGAADKQKKEEEIKNIIKYVMANDLNILLTLKENLEKLGHNPGDTRQRQEEKTTEEYPFDHTGFKDLVEKSTEILTRSTGNTPPDANDSVHTTMTASILRGDIHGIGKQQADKLTTAILRTMKHGVASSNVKGIVKLLATWREGEGGYFLDLRKETQPKASESIINILTAFAESFDLRPKNQGQSRNRGGDRRQTGNRRNNGSRFYGNRQ